MTRRIVVVSSANDLDTEALADELLASEYAVSTAENGRAAREYMEKQGLPHLMLIDLRITDEDGLQLARDLKVVALIAGVEIELEGDPDVGIGPELMKASHDNAAAGESVLGAIDVSRRDQTRVGEYRRLWALFWLLMLLPGNPADGRNPAGTLERAATRLLAQM